jgi:transcriptional regulator with XRE-family HTH domain
MVISAEEEGGRLPRLSGSPERDVPAIVGTNLKRLRKNQGHSLERLAELSGVSRAMLGQIETGKSVPTVSLLWKVADALGVPVTELIATQTGSTTVVLPRSGAAVLASSNGRFARRPLFPLERFRGAEFYELRIAPGHSEVMRPQPAGTRENLVVAAGELRVSIEDAQPIALAEGDAILFEGDVTHSYQNPTGSEVLAFIVVTRGGGG